MVEVVVVIVKKDNLDDKLGISLKTRSDDEVIISSLAEDGLYAPHKHLLKIGMAVLSVDGVPAKGRSPADVAKQMKGATGDIRLEAFDKKGPNQHIIMKKKMKTMETGSETTTAKTLSFHGFSMSADIAKKVQSRFDVIPKVPTANKLVLDDSFGPHYQLTMNDDCALYHEEDAVSAVFDAMAAMGYKLLTQYSSGATRASYCDCYVFEKSSVGMLAV